LTTYKVAADAPMLRLDEITEGDGGLCGSVYLNRRFEDVVRKKIGKQLDALPKTVSLEAMSQVKMLHLVAEVRANSSRFKELSTKRRVKLTRLCIHRRTRYAETQQIKPDFGTSDDSEKTYSIESEFKYSSYANPCSLDFDDSARQCS
jgi:hypothetical protein